MMTVTDERLQQMRLRPVASDMTQPRHARGTPLAATGETAERIIRRVATLSGALGTKIDFDGRLGIVRVSA
jgi:hypothetical protein